MDFGVEIYLLRLLSWWFSCQNTHAHAQTHLHSHPQLPNDTTDVFASKTLNFWEKRSIIDNRLAACTHRWYAALGARRQISPPGSLLDKRGNLQRPSQPPTATITHQEPVGKNGEQRCCKSENRVAALLAVYSFILDRANSLLIFLIFKLNLA